MTIECAAVHRNLLVGVKNACTTASNTNKMGRPFVADYADPHCEDCADVYGVADAFVDAHATELAEHVRVIASGYDIRYIGEMANAVLTCIADMARDALPLQPQGEALHGAEQLLARFSMSDFYSRMRRYIESSMSIAPDGYCVDDCSDRSNM